MESQSFKACVVPKQAQTETTEASRELCVCFHPLMTHLAYQNGSYQHLIKARFLTMLSEVRTTYSPAFHN